MVIIFVLSLGMIRLLDDIDIKKLVKLNDARIRK